MVHKDNCNENLRPLHMVGKMPRFSSGKTGKINLVIGGAELFLNNMDLVNELR